MKRIYLVRHAKSSWSNSELPDVDRPLNERGYKNAHEMGAFLMKTNHKAQLCISSTAVRAVSTALIFSREGLFYAGNILLEPDLYESSTEEYLRVIQGQDDRHASLYLFAHNPTISEVYNLFCPGNNEELTTCNAAIIEFEADTWEDVKFKNGKSIAVYKPASLPPM